MYEINLTWKHVDKPLNSNKNGSIARFKSLLKRFEKDPELMNSYDNIIQEQLTEIFIKKVTKEAVLDLNLTYHKCPSYPNQLKVQNSELFLYLYLTLRSKCSTERLH